MGCGTGNYTQALTTITKKVIGIVLSPGILKQAQIKSSELSLIQGDVTHLPFYNESFDGACADQVLHHIKEKTQLLKEACRVLKKGARLAIDSCSHQQMHSFWIYHYFPKGLDLDLVRIPDINEIVSLLERSGFSSVKIETSYTDIAFEHNNPEHYPDVKYRNSHSTFCLLSDKYIKLGCEKLREDITSCAVENIILSYEEKETKTGGSCIIYGQKRSE
jgi:SAM-dependent methyltransferase